MVGLGHQKDSHTIFKPSSSIIHCNQVVDVTSINKIAVNRGVSVNERKQDGNELNARCGLGK
jgi:hypothetical protein